ncbi:MAG: dTDP-4-dehydrorhamnose reductase [Chloroflexi bacterium]|nr:dTDP-4-dehydrorhamnose reductase [Chloroflexota bacterium]
MRILLLGSSGQVGWEAQRSLAPLGEVIGYDYPEVDFSRPERLYRQVLELRPDVIYNAAAYTAVDKAEREPERARVVNAASTGVLAEAAAKLGAVLVHFSTDYVFDGKKGFPYTESDPTDPLNVYGLTKLEGEQAIQQVGGAYLIFRTAWVYSKRRDSFLSKVLQWSRERSSLRVVADQVSNPTWARMLAEITGQLLARGGENLFDWVIERSGVYHLAGDGIASRFDWARAILQNARTDAGEPVEVLPAESSEFPSPAVRPLYSALDCSRFADTFGLRLPAWEKALSMAMQE